MDNYEHLDIISHPQSLKIQILWHRFLRGSAIQKEVVVNLQKARMHALMH